MIWAAHPYFWKTPIWICFCQESVLSTQGQVDLRCLFTPSHGKEAIIGKSLQQTAVPHPGAISISPLTAWTAWKKCLALCLVIYFGHLQACFFELIISVIADSKKHMIVSESKVERIKSKQKQKTEVDFSSKSKTIEFQSQLEGRVSLQSN